MENQPGGNERKSTGFAFTRRQVLKTGTAIGAASSLAGCGELDLNGTPTQTRADLGAEGLTPNDLVDDGLTVVKSELVDDPYRVDMQNRLNRQLKTARFIRVRVRNDVGNPIGSVTLSVDLFDDNSRFRSVQLATIADMQANEVFEGYIPFTDPRVSLYLIHARRSRRRPEPQSVDGLRLRDHCLDDEQVRGTVANDGSTTIERSRVRVRFLNNSGDPLGVATDTVAELGAGESRHFEVDLDTLVDGRATKVTDYSIDVGDYEAGASAIR